jgi:hypothetical protein
VIDFFAPDYFTARTRFRSAVLTRGGQIESILLDAKGPARNDLVNNDLTPTDLTPIDLTPIDLTIDIGWFGSPVPKRAFIHSSGLHGVEGFAGSAIQLQWLEEGIPDPAPDCAIALVHALNPFGMAWLRRVNENNVDLNRNFLAADCEFSGAPDDYAALNTFLNPTSPPSSPVMELFALRAAGKILHYGMPALRRAIASGQYDFPRGLFFGGKRREQGTRRFQLYISGRFSDSSRLVAIDVHTGLGRFGEDCLLVSDDEQRLGCATEMHVAFGGRVQSSDAKEIGYRPRGAQDGLYFRMFPAAQVYFAVQEFGTRHPLAVLAALRAENCGHHYGADGAPEIHRAKQRLLEVFCPPDKRWREQVLRRGREVIRQALSLAFD